MVSDPFKTTPARAVQQAESSCSEITVGQIFGEFLENLPESREYLLLVFSPSSLPLKKRWRTNGLSADFLADYLAVFFPGDEGNPETVGKQDQIQGTVSYIANELLENAMKFSDDGAPTSIRIELQLYLSKLVFLVTNSIKPNTIQSYQAFIQEVLASNPSEMLFRRLEQLAQDDTLKCSGLGLVTIMNDYSARLGWKFETIPGTPEVTIVTTMVQVNV